MRLMNINEEIPEIFYIFVGQGNNSFSRANYHNYKLSKKIISSGFLNLMTDFNYKKDFINGDIVYVPFVPNKTTFNLPSSHRMSVINGYQVEYILECTRNNTFNKYPSRLSCLYAFGDYASCQKASKLYKWDLNRVKKFKLVKTNTELDDCIKVVKCNMEIVTRMWNCDIVTFDKDSIDRSAIAYWNGVGQIATEQIDIDTGLCVQKVSDVLYEYLIEGILEEIE